MSSIVIVVGMNREAQAVRGMGRVVVGARDLGAALNENATGVVSFGLCGALDPSLAPGDLIVGTGVVVGDRRFDSDAAWAARLGHELSATASGVFAASDDIVATARAKSALRARTGAIAADMESHRVAAAAAARGLPFAIVRSVSDSAHDTLPHAAQAGFRPDGRMDVVAVLRVLARSPNELPALLRTARHAAAGFKTLDRVGPALSRSFQV